MAAGIGRAALLLVPLLFTVLLAVAVLLASFFFFFFFFVDVVELAVVSPGCWRRTLLPDATVAGRLVVLAVPVETVRYRLSIDRFAVPAVAG